MLQTGLALAVAATSFVAQIPELPVPPPAVERKPGPSKPVAGPPILVQYAQTGAGRSVTVLLDGKRTKSTYAGVLGFRDASSAWSSVCADVRAPVAKGQRFNVRPIAARELGGNIFKAGAIVAKYVGQVRTADECAGLQLAVWEAIEDGGEQANFASGKFAARAPQAALNFAQQMYLNAKDPGETLYLQAGDGGGQSQLTTRQAY
ncbi:MAG TPA: hypothetical protein PLX06_10895 [Fimbriimonadaceae bacterium]|nr:hypothetical protein [Fimbriimonadaceae bacterium]